MNADQNNTAQGLHPDFALWANREADRLQDRKEEERDEAFRAVAAARKELDQIEEQIRLADADEPHYPVGYVQGLDVRPVFGFFGVLREQAKFAKYVEAARNDA